VSIEIHFGPEAIMIPSHRQLWAAQRDLSRPTSLNSGNALSSTPGKIAVIFYTMVKQQVEYDETLGTSEKPRGRNGWEQNSNGKPNDGATNLSPSNPLEVSGSLTMPPWQRPPRPLRTL
jgi:hypothetical protein